MKNRKSETTARGGSLRVLSIAGTIALLPFACGGNGGNGNPDGGGGGDGGMGTGTLTAAERCTAITQSIQNAGFSAKVTVSCDAKYANVVSDTYPNHVKMTGITGTNDQVPVPAPGYTSPITLSPVHAAAPTSIDAALGVA